MDEHQPLSLPDQKKTWSDFGLDDRIKKAISKHKWASPTPVQAAAIPYALQGKDILANAKTGSGKTAAYVLPIIQRIITEKEIPGTRPCVRGLVLVPTTELAEQVRSVISSLCHYCVHLVRCLRLTADEGIYQQIPRLAEIPDIIVATPGRLLLHLEKQSVSLRGVQMLVIDEADLIMSFGYVQDLEKIKGYLPSTCQGFLMSATLSQEVTSLKNLVLFAPVILELEEVVVEEKLKQFIIQCTRQEKFLLLYVLLKLKLVSGKTIIFVNTMDRCFQVKLFLDRFMVPCVLLNADLPQNSRYHILQQFNRGAIEILIATDEKKQTEKDKITKEVVIKKTTEKKPQKKTENNETEEKSTETEEDLPADGPEEEDPDTSGGGSSAILDEESLENLDDLDHLDDDDSLGELEDDAGEGPASDPLGDTGVPSPDNLGDKNTESRDNDEESLEEEDDSEEKEVHDKKSNKPQQEQVQNQIPDEQNPENPDQEFGVARGIDFRNVANVINFDFPLSVDGYVHRVGRTARAGRVGAALSLIANTDMEMFDQVSKHQATLGCSIQTFTYKTAVLEGFRYRVEDVLRSISKHEIREARGEQIKLEMLNSQKLKSHFEENPADLYALKHDKELQKKKIKPHLKHIPFYLMPSPADLKKRLTPSDVTKYVNDDRIVYNMKQIKRKRKSNPLKSFSYSNRKRGRNDTENTRGGKRRKITKTKRRDKMPKSQFKPRPYPIT